MKKERRGRPKSENKGVKVSWAIPKHIYESLLEEQQEIEKMTGVKVLISKIAYKRMEKR